MVGWIAQAPLVSGLIVAMAIGLMPYRPVLADRSLFDDEAIVREVQRVTPGEEYVESLPRRWAECADQARLLGAGATADMIHADRLRAACLRAMTLQLGALYYAPEAFAYSADEFGPWDLEGNFDRVHGSIVEFNDRIYNGTPDCFTRGCGTLFAVLPLDISVGMLADVVEMMAIRTGRIHDIPTWRKAWAAAPGA